MILQMPLLGLFHLLLSEIKRLSSWMQVEFKHNLHLTNDLADFMAKQWVDHSIPFFDLFLVIFLTVFGTRLYTITPPSY